MLSINQFEDLVFFLKDKCILMIYLQSKYGQLFKITMKNDLIKISAIADWLKHFRKNSNNT